MRRRYGDSRFGKWMPVPIGLLGMMCFRSVAFMNLKYFNLKCFSVLCFILALPLIAPAQTTPSLEVGYREMYNLQFEDAHNTFHNWQQLNPGDPMGPSSDAAAYLFSELDRLGVLQTELFVDDEKFKKAEKLVPDPAAKQGFDGSLNRSELLADKALMGAPQDKNALFAEVMNHGLRGDYTALIEKRRLASLSDMKSAGTLASKLLAMDPSYYDAYLAGGIENYILGLSAAPLRWALRLYGAETDKDQGIARLQLTAEKGHFMGPFARLLLAVAALRANNKPRARELLDSLAREFPHNKLYVRELARLQ